MRISDWSSDVCSSDLFLAIETEALRTHRPRREREQAAVATLLAKELFLIGAVPEELGVERDDRRNARGFWRGRRRRFGRCAHGLPDRCVVFLRPPRVNRSEPALAIADCPRRGAIA